MISYAQINEDDTVLEIGSGLGFLTELLSQRCKRVIAVEFDPKLVEISRKRLLNLRNVTIFQGDIFKLALPSFSRVVSAPPYSISSPLLLWLFDRNFGCAVLIFQKEFAERILAQPNSKGYGRLPVITYYCADVELLDDVPRRVFWPPPKVDSMIVRLKPKKPPFSVKNEELFFEVLRVLFTQKNRKVRNAIKPFLEGLKLSERDAEELLRTLPFLNKRALELAPEDFGLMVNEIVERIHGKIFKKPFIQPPQEN